MTMLNSKIARMQRGILWNAPVTKFERRSAPYIEKFDELDGTLSFEIRLNITEEIERLTDKECYC